jgi:hypothetical protein
MRVARESDRKPPKQSWLRKGRYGRLVGTRNDRPVESHYFVFAGQETFIKVRSTFVPGALDPKALEIFVDDLLASVTPHYECPGVTLTRDPSVLYLPIFIPIEAPMQSLPRLVDSILTGMGYGFDFRWIDEGRWRTLPVLIDVPPRSWGPPFPIRESSLRAIRKNRIVPDRDPGPTALRIRNRTEERGPRM